MALKNNGGGDGGGGYQKHICEFILTKEKWQQAIKIVLHVVKKIR